MGATDRPGREIPKEYREVVAELIDHQGWRYTRGKRHPTLYPAAVAQPALPVPTTPSDRRGLRNFIADVRARGGAWPPERRR